jgi:putative Mg2+ transporter-C (MgtC) family protein
MHLDHTQVMLFRLFLASVLGGVVGVERQIHRKPAGIRTSMFICMGSALFTMLSESVAHHLGDPNTVRIVSNLIPGIGFLGAGAIIRDRGTVVGLTTASVIFVMAGVGMGIGAGVYEVPVLTVMLMLLALILLGWAEGYFGLKTRLLLFRFSVQNLETALAGLQESLSAAKVQMQRFQVLHIGQDFSLEFEAEVNYEQHKRLVARFSEIGKNCEVVEREGGSSG